MTCRRFGWVRRAARWSAVLLMGVMGGGCGSPKCTNEAFFGLPSPDGAFIAFIFHRRCAGNAGVSTDVTVQDFHSALRNEPGNVLSVAGEQPVRVSWLGATRLGVSGFIDPIRLRRERAGPVTIEYRSR